MNLAKGARLGPYEVLAPLGAGGMGEVYSARDTRLGREVAIKVLADAAASDPERMRWFEREARSASALNHPNILTVHDVGTHEGSPYLVTELLEGKTLGDAMLEKALSVARAVEFATQIARGLGAAHEKGIVHRDLKPENLFLTEDGRVKILDFGLARLVHREARDEELTKAPTLSRASGTSAVVGTVGYMSPEQVRGEAADARSDVFSFGCVLYEMLTGERAFAQPTAAETMTAILREEPRPLDERRPEVSPIVRRLVERCLAKAPDARFQSGRELLLLLEIAGTAPTLPQALGWIGKARETATRRAALGFLIAAALGGAALAAAILLGLLGLFPRNETRARRLPVVSSLSFTRGPGAPLSIAGASDIALSADGSRLAYVGMATDGTRALWIRELDSTSPRELPGTAYAQNPFWSPDSRFVGFFAEGKLKKVAVDGGAIQTLCDWSSTYGLGATWNRDGVILFEDGGSILRTSETGGAPQVVLERGPEEVALRFPSFLPDGEHFLYIARRLEGPHHVYVGSLSGSEPPKLVHEGHYRAEYSATGHLLFVEDGVLVAQPFDGRTLRKLGDPQPVAPGILSHQPRGQASFSVSAHGDLAYVEASGMLTELIWKDRNGRTLERLTEPGRYIGVVLAPDGRRVAVEIEDEETNQHVAWILDPARGVRSRLTKPPHDSHHPAWSPDGREIAFSSDRAGRWVAYARRADGLGEEILLERRPEFVFSYPRQWLPNGNVLVSASKSEAEARHLWLLPLKEGEPATPLVDGIWGAVSPDGRWLAVAAPEAGRVQVYVLPFPALDTRWPVSAEGGTWPQWRADGRELFYVSDTRFLMSVRIQGAPRFEAAPPEPLFPLPAAVYTGLYQPPNYAVAQDGERFLIGQIPEHASALSVTLVTDWEGLLRKQ